MQRRLWVSIGILLSCAILGAGCALRQPILLGFAAQLTGPQSDIGVDSRDGVLLAIDEINAAGGIAGQPLELIIRDDKGDPEVARQVDAELVQLGVIAIIGHTTSGQSAAVIDQMNAAQVILFSPTTSSDQFTDKDDYFFRIVAATSVQARSLARHIRELEIDNIGIVYDLGNRAYSQTYWQYFSDEFRARGGAISGEFPFTSGRDDLNSVIDAVNVSQPDALLFVSSAFDTALMAQYARQRGIRIPLFASGWCQTEELLNKGGQAVEGMEILAIYHPESQQPAFLAFVNRFQERYQRLPAFGAVYGYDSIMALSQALQQSGNSRERLREELSRLRHIEGLQGRLTLDAYGDVRRDLYIATVQHGRFETTAVITPTP